MSEQDRRQAASSEAKILGDKGDPEATPQPTPTPDPNNLGGTVREGDDDSGQS